MRMLTNSYFISGLFNSEKKGNCAFMEGDLLFLGQAE